MKRPIVTNYIAEQDPTSATIGAKGTAMMEDGLSKLGKVTPKFENLEPRLSGATPKTILTDSLFSLPQSNNRIPVSGNKQEEWIPVHFKTPFKDDNLRQRQGVMVLLPLGVQLSSNVIAVVQSEGTILKISIKVPEAVMDPKQFLCFQKKGIYCPLMEICVGARISTFYETMSTVHTRLCNSMYREFQIKTGFPLYGGYTYPCRLYTQGIRQIWWISPFPYLKNHPTNFNNQ